MARYKKPSNYGLWEEIVCGKNKGLLGEKNLKTLVHVKKQRFTGRYKGLWKEMKP